MPGIDDLAIDRGLAANCVETSAIDPCGGEGMADNRRIEASDRAGRALEAGGERLPLGGSLDDITHQNSPAAPSSKVSPKASGSNFAAHDTEKTG
jgi:hypothetical protein